MGQIKVELFQVGVWLIVLLIVILVFSWWGLNYKARTCTSCMNVDSGTPIALNKENAALKEFLA